MHRYIHTYILYLFVVITANIEGPYIIFLWQGTSSYFAAIQDDCGDMCFAFIQFGGRNRVGRGTSIYAIMYEQVDRTVDTSVNR